PQDNIRFINRKFITNFCYSEVMKYICFDEVYFFMFTHLYCIKKYNYLCPHHHASPFLWHFWLYAYRAQPTHNLPEKRVRLVCRAAFLPYMRQTNPTILIRSAKFFI